MFSCAFFLNLQRLLQPPLKKKKKFKKLTQGLGIDVKGRSRSKRPGNLVNTELSRRDSRGLKRATSGDIPEKEVAVRLRLEHVLASNLTIISVQSFDYRNPQYSRGLKVLEKGEKKKKKIKENEENK